MVVDICDWKLESTDRCNYRSLLESRDDRIIHTSYLDRGNEKESNKIRLRIEKFETLSVSSERVEIKVTVFTMTQILIMELIEKRESKPD